MHISYHIMSYHSMSYRIVSYHDTSYVRLWYATGVCEINTHLDAAGVFNFPTPLPSFDRGDGGSPTLSTSRVSVYFTDTGIISYHLTIHHTLYYGVLWFTLFCYALS